MCASVRRPVLYDYFKTSADVLLSEYQRSRNQGASDNLGYNRELFLTGFLSRVLPSRLTVRRGEVWDARGNRTGQLEIVILRDDCPSLTFAFAGADTYLVEGVFAVVEVKSNLTRGKLQEALGTLRLVKSLDVITSGASITSGPVLHRPLRCVFAYEGASWNIIVDEVTKPDNAGVADLVCILARGALVARGHFLTWEGDSPYKWCDGKAVALAWLYLHLVSYSTSFVGRSLGLRQYFEPLNGWEDVGASSNREG